MITLRNLSLLWSQPDNKSPGCFHISIKFLPLFHSCFTDTHLGRLTFDITNYRTFISSLTKEGKVKGICGSGLISVVAELLEAGLLDSTGRLADPDEVENPDLKKRFFKLDKIAAFMLSTNSDENVYISQKDIRELQLAKGAIRTGIDMLLAETGVDLQTLKKIRLAGNFGSGVDIAKTIRIGLIPEVPIEKVDVVGNAALRGASLALVSKVYREKAGEIYKKCRFLELAAKPDFQTRFASSMFF